MTNGGTANDLGQRRRCSWCGVEFVVKRPGQTACRGAHGRLTTLRKKNIVLAAAPKPVLKFDPARLPESLYTWPTRAKKTAVVVAIVVPGDPLSKQRPRATLTDHGMRVYTPRDTVQAEELIHSTIRIANRELLVDADQAYCVRLSFHTATMQRRDVDNMTKLVMDACTGVVWKDDSQVVEMHARVLRADPEPRTELLIASLGTGFIRVERPCLTCGRLIRRYPSGANIKYCSATCLGISRRTRPRPACIICGAEARSPWWVKRPVCSDECYEKAHFLTADCPRCGKPFRMRRSWPRKFCSEECRREAGYAGRQGKSYGRCEVCGGGTTRKEYVRCAKHQVYRGRRSAPLEQSAIS